jgi:hypothetical protein
MRELDHRDAGGSGTAGNIITTGSIVIPACSVQAAFLTQVYFVATDTVAAFFVILTMRSLQMGKYAEPIYDRLLGKKYGE